jgi:hypothetical protein
MPGRYRLKGVINMTETEYVKHRISVEDHWVSIPGRGKSPDPILTTDYLGTIFKTMCPEHKPLWIPIKSESVAYCVYDQLKGYLHRVKPTEAEYKEGVVHQLVLIERGLMVLSQHSVPGSIMTLPRSFILRILYQYANVLAKALYDRYLIYEYSNSDLENHIGTAEFSRYNNDYAVITEVNQYISLGDTENGPNEDLMLRALFSFDDELYMSHLSDLYVHTMPREEKKNFGPEQQAERDRISEVSELYQEIWNKHVEKRG